jgi:hypothetical protein
MLGRGAQKKRRPPDLTHQRIKIPSMKKNIEVGDTFTLPSRFALFFITYALPELLSLARNFRRSALALWRNPPPVG